MREAIRVLQQTRVLEPAATRLAVQRMTPAKLDIIRAAYERQNEQNEQTRIEDLVQCDLEFHAAITRASDNDTLHSILDGLSNKTVRLRIWGGIVSDNAAGLTIDHHRLILKAITDGDPHLAEAAALVHMTHARGWLDAYLDDRPPHPVRPQGQRTRRPAPLQPLLRGART